VRLYSGHGYRAERTRGWRGRAELRSVIVGEALRRMNVEKGQIKME
jgi:hypothetical protein